MTADSCSPANARRMGTAGAQQGVQLAREQHQVGRLHPGLEQRDGRAAAGVGAGAGTVAAGGDLQRRDAARHQQRGHGRGVGAVQFAPDVAARAAAGVGKSGHQSSAAVPTRSASSSVVRPANARRSASRRRVRPSIWRRPAWVKRIGSPSFIASTSGWVISMNS